MYCLAKRMAVQTHQGQAPKAQDIKPLNFLVCYDEIVDSIDAYAFDL